MEAPTLTRIVSATTDAVEAAEVPPDPFERADLLDACLRLGHSVMTLAEKIVEVERAHRKPYQKPDNSPDPKPRPKPPAKPAPRPPRRPGR